MPKINGKPVDPKAYAARMTQAKKKIASLDPATKMKLKEFYPATSNKDIVSKNLDANKNLGRTLGGIVKGGQKFVNKIYRNLSDSAYNNSGLQNPSKKPKKQIN